MPNNNFYFIEVNARIQVEHPVTEMVTGIDLVKQQIRIAAGERLPFSQSEIADPGPLVRVPDQLRGPRQRLPPLPRQDHRAADPGWPRRSLGLARPDSATRVPPNYDSLVGKLIVHGSDRAEALAVMRRALDELVIEGIQTTIPLHRRIFRNRDFIEGRVDTTWVERVLMAPRLSAHRADPTRALTTISPPHDHLDELRPTSVREE